NRVLDDLFGKFEFVLREGRFQKRFEKEARKKIPVASEARSGKTDRIPSRKTVETRGRPFDQSRDLFRRTGLRSLRPNIRKKIARADVRVGRFHRIDDLESKPPRNGGLDAHHMRRRSFPIIDG